jgi:hypothetical protein
MMIVLLLFLQKQNLANAIYLFGLTMVVQRERMQGGKTGEDAHRKFNVEEGGG